MSENGIIQLYNEQSNELFQMNRISFSQFLKNFHGNEAVVFFYVVNNIDRRTNIFYGTHEKICKAVHLSRPTVSKAMKHMKSLGVVRPMQVGVWEVNLENITNKSPLSIAEQG